MLNEELKERIEQAGMLRQGVMLTNGEAAALLSRLEALTAENERLLVSNEQWQVDYNEAVIDKLELETENEKLRERLAGLVYE